VITTCQFVFSYFSKLGTMFTILKIPPATGAVRSQRGQWGHGPPITGVGWMVGNGVPITGCLIRRVTKYGGFQDACIRISFPVLATLSQKCS